MSTCDKCGTDLTGRPGWARDWTVIDADGARLVTRYTCDTCEGMTQ